MAIFPSNSGEMYLSLKTQSKDAQSILKQLGKEKYHDRNDRIKPLQIL